MDDGQTSTLDPTLFLPDAIIHHICTLLPSKEATRTSVFSKTWLSAWRTYPNLEFMQQNFDKLAFLNVVDQTLSRYQQHNEPIEVFRLHAELYNKNLTANDVDKWIKIAIDKGVKVLSLLFSPKLSYSLPHCVFASKTLLELDLYQCRLDFSELDIGLHSLRRLYLKRVHIDENLIEKLLCGIPLVQDLRLDLCKGFKKIKVVNLDRLKFFEIGVLNQMDLIEIDSPSLESLTYAINELNKSCDHLDLYTTQNLKRVSLSGANMVTDELLCLLISQCHLLEDLELQHCDALKKITVSHYLLKRFKIYWCQNLQSLTFDAPSLISVDYKSIWMVPTTFKTPPSPLLKAFVSLAPKSYQFHIQSSLNKLRSLLTYVSRSHVVLNVDENMFLPVQNLDGIKHMQPLMDQVEVLLLDVVANVAIPKLLTVYSLLLEGFLIVFHPKYIYVSSTCCDKVFAKFVLQNLVIDRGTSNSCFGAHYNKYWLAYLRDVAFEVTAQHCGRDQDDEVWEPLPCQSLADASHIFEQDRRFRFRLHWL